MHSALRTIITPANRLVLLLAAAVLGARPGLAQPPAEDRKILKSEVLLDNLDNPCGLALRPPNSGELFLAESGAGRVLRVRLGERAVSAVAIEGFPRADFGAGPKYQLGPLAVGFVDRTTLVVGEGGAANDADAVRVFQLPDDGKTLNFDQSKHTLRPPKAETAGAHEGKYFAIAAAHPKLFVASSGDVATGWVFRADLASLSPPVLGRLIPTKRETGGMAPMALTMSKRGELVVANAGELGAAGDSVLSFYHATSGKRLLKLDTGLHDIVGLDYAISGLLYAVDFSWSDPGAGGLFRLDMELRGGRQAIKAVKLLPLDRPAGIVIASDRLIYVTTFGGGGAAEMGGKTGQLIRIEKTDGNL